MQGENNCILLFYPIVAKWNCDIIAPGKNCTK